MLQSHLIESPGKTFRRYATNRPSVSLIIPNSVAHASLCTNKLLQPTSPERPTEQLQNSQGFLKILTPKILEDFLEDFSKIPLLNRA
jgi:hypothetical protein